MPTGYYVRQRKENDFKKEEYFNKLSVEWLDYVAYWDSTQSRRTRIGRFPVDGLTVESFADDVSDARRQGDSDPSTAIIAETMKLFGNSGYGSS